MSADLPSVGQTLGKYQIMRVLGTGAMGAVFLAQDTVLGRQVAIKVVRPNFAGDPNFHARFLREARTLAQLNHPNVVQIYDVSDGSSNNLPYLVTEFVDGEDLHLVLRHEKRLPWKRALTLCRQIALGLETAAAKQIVHRDVKPGNILVTHEGVAKVTDFGLAKPLVGDNNITKVQVVMGTPNYIAPEQAMGQEVDWRADQYALGCTLFHLLSGTPPFVDGSPAEICAAHVYQDYPSISRLVKDLPVGLETILQQMVAKRPSQRFQSYRELVTAFAKLLRPVTKQPQKPKKIALLIVDSGPLVGLRMPVDSHSLIIGRLPECDLTLDDPRASRKHAVVQFAGEQVELRDLGSRNGVLVDDQSVRHAMLDPGQLFQVGDTRMHIEIEAADLGVDTDTDDDEDMFSGAVAITAEYPRPGRDELFSADDDRAAPGDNFSDKSDFVSPLFRIVAKDTARLLNERAKGDDSDPLQPTTAEVVILRMNLLGVERLIQELSAKEALRRINDSLEILGAQVFAQQGSLDLVTGDALQAIFGAPIPVAGAISKAAFAALRGMDALLEAQRALDNRFKLGVCAGLAKGQALLGLYGPSARQDYGAVGEGSVLARSLGARAPIGCLLCEARSAHDLDVDLVAKARPDLSFRHGAETVAVFQVGERTLRRR